MKTRDQFTMLKLDKSMGELQRGSLFSPAPKTPLQERRRYDRRDHHHDENGGKGRVIENPFSLDCKAEPEPAKINPTSPRGIMPMPIENPVQIFVQSAQPACLLPDDSRHGQHSRQCQYLNAKQAGQNQFLNPSGRKIMAQEMRTRDEAFYRATDPPLVNICPWAQILKSIPRQRRRRSAPALSSPTNKTTENTSSATR